ncbi:MAG: ZIP family metal transporter [Acidobacteriota bacterium]|nr:ZIP family metal transporter [Acidobacteriota bacterium]MDE3146132.1 ZIP family metal transporter [Acidobacteriota bacterium]
MSELRILVMGGIAGGTIFLGLPIGRLRSLRPGPRQFLNALAIGILLFLVWDVLAHGFIPVDTALTHLHDRTGGLGPVLGYSALFLGGIATGLLGLIYYERWLGRRTASPSTLTPAKHLAMLIAVGIGLHNFGEGLAIGASSAKGQIGLATVLVIGFALHNATEGFGIVAPFAAEQDRPSWKFLFWMGIIGGGPTFVGTLLGSQFTSDAVSVVFLSLAAGSILYVVEQLLGVAHRRGSREILGWGLACGLAAGFITDMIVTAGGA